jgi:hypothetical protein
MADFLKTALSVLILARDLIFVGSLYVALLTLIEIVMSAIESIEQFGFVPRPKTGRRVKKEQQEEEEQLVTESKYFQSDPCPSPMKSRPPSRRSVFKQVAIESGFQEGKLESNLPERPTDEFKSEEAVIPAELYIKNMTDSLRFECCLGNCAPLMQFARENYGNLGQGGMKTSQVRAWLKKNPEHIPFEFRGGAKFHIDHVIPEAFNPICNWPINYMIMPASVNLHFGKYVTAEKIKFVGKENFQAASEFARWCGLKSLAHVEFRQHDRMTDHFLVQRSR